MSNPLAELVVKKIMEDLNGRKGFDLRILPDEIQDEIKETWIGIVEKYIL
jgi:hypothetical protein